MLLCLMIMKNYHNSPFNHPYPWVALLKLCLFMMVGMFLGDVFYVFCFKKGWILFFPENIYLELCRTGMMHGSVFFGSSFLYLHYKKIHWHFFLKEKIKIVFLLYTLFLISFGILCSIFLSYWNTLLSFPESLHWLTQWLEQQEIKNHYFLRALLDIKGVFPMLFVWIVIGWIPAICEEFFFRGIVQNIFIRLLTPHGSVFFTAFFFSIMHLEIYSFLPRFFLGIILGYIFFYTKHIFFPILAHLLNNSLVLAFLYIAPDIFLQQKKTLPFSWIIFMYSFLSLIYCFYSLQKHKTISK